MKITWWGHATATIELGGVRVLTDPLFGARLAHLRRLGPVPPAVAHHADAVLVSHLHLDHLHVPSLRSVDARDVVVPRGGGSLAAGPWQVHEVAPGDARTLGGVTVTAVAAHHDGRRWPGSRLRGPALGYLLSHDDVRVWFAGDTGPFDAMAALAPVDLAILPVGGWGPTLGPGHLDPAQAAAAARLVGARHVVPIHYGTFWSVGLRRAAPGLTARRFDAPGRDFAAALEGSRVEAHVLASGDSVTLR